MNIQDTSNATQSVTVFLLDNVDSFTYNLVDEIRCLGYELVVYRNDSPLEKIITAVEAHQGKKMLMLSPGPGEPKNAGCLLPLIRHFRGRVPMLGICLGHQAIVSEYGGTIGHAGETVHGKTSKIEHHGKDMFAGLPQPMQVARYHSLMATQVPDTLDVIATYENVVMAVTDKIDNVLGLQFHPESILTPQGSILLKQSIEYLLQEATC